MRRLGESEVGPYPTAIEAEWAFIYSVRPWLQMDDKCSDLGLHSAASFFRCGHVNIIIDPSAFKENVASGMGLSFSVLDEYFVGIEGGALRAGSFFLTYEIAYGVSKSDRIHGGAWPLESMSRSYESRTIIVCATVSGSKQGVHLWCCLHRFNGPQAEAGTGRNLAYARAEATWELNWVRRSRVLAK